MQAYAVSDVTKNSFVLKFIEDYRKNNGNKLLSGLPCYLENWEKSGNLKIDQKIREKSGNFKIDQKIREFHKIDSLAITN